MPSLQSLMLAFSFVLSVLTASFGGVGASRPTGTQPATRPTTQLTTQPTTRPALQTWAIVPSATLGGWELCDLVQAGLAAAPGIRMLEREQIGAALRELAVAEVAGADAVGARLKLGRLLGADVLVFLSVRNGHEPGSVLVEMAVARTDQGVRVAMKRMVWEPTRVEAIASELAKTALDAAPLTWAADLRLVAVPPFESQDIYTRYLQDRETYARLTTQLLLGRSNLAVVELAEAQAVSRELAIAGTSLHRPLPYYFIGSYRNTGSNDAPTASLHLELRQGESTLRSEDRGKVQRHQASVALDIMLNALLKDLSERPAACDLAMEGKLLAERGDVFRQVSEWDEALALYQAALLCRPRDCAVRERIVQALSQLMSSGIPDAPYVRELSYSPRARMELAHAVLDHLARWLEFDPANPPVVEGFYSLATSFDLLRYDAGGDWDHAMPLYREAMRRHEALTGALLKEPQRCGLKDADLERLVRHIARVIADYGQSDPSDAIAFGARLLETVEGSSERAGLLTAELDAGKIVLRAVDQPCGEIFLNRLEVSAAPRLHLVASMLRQLDTLGPAATREQALQTLDELIGSNPERPAVLQWARQQAQMATASEPMMVPQIVNVNTGFPYRTGVYVVNVFDWQMIRPGFELVATSAGLYRATGPAQTPFLAEYGGLWLTWDGEYIWTIAREYIQVVAADGTQILFFKKSDLPTFHFSARCNPLIPVAPGRVCMVGQERLANDGVRSWLAMLSWKGTGAARKPVVETFFEARERQTESKDKTIQTAFTSAWAVVMPHGGPQGRPVMLIDRSGGAPLIVDTQTLQARVAPGRWPTSASVAQDGDALYLTPVLPDRKIYKATSADASPEPVMEILPADVTAGVLPSYYTTAVVLDRKLHMIGERAGAYRWIAADLETKQSYLLANPLPSQCTPWPRLTRSQYYDLILRSTDYRAFGVRLPAAKNWPLLSEHTLPAVNPEEKTAPSSQPETIAVEHGFKAPPGDEERCLRAHTYYVFSVDFCPEGRTALSSGWFGDNSINLWDVATGKTLRGFAGDKGGAFWCVVASPDGRYAASAGFNKDIRIWDLQEQRQIRQWNLPMPAFSLAFSPDGKRLLAGCNTGRLRMFDINEGQVWSAVAHRDGAIARVAYSHDGRHILSSGGARDFFILLADAATGREIRRLVAHHEIVRCVQFSPDDRRALSCDAAGIIRLWDLQTGKVLKKFRVKDMGVTSVAFLPDGQRFVSADGHVRDPYGFIRADGSRETEMDLASAKNYFVRLWDIPSGREIHRFAGHTLDIRSIAVSRDGRYALTGSHDCTVRLWNLAKAATQPALELADASQTPDGPASRGQSSGTEPPGTSPGIAESLTLLGARLLVQWQYAAAIMGVIAIPFALAYASRRLRRK